MAIELQRSVHTIDDVTLTFSRIAAQSVGENKTRMVTIEVDGEKITAAFTSNGFELLRAIMREY